MGSFFSKKLRSENLSDANDKELLTYIMNKTEKINKLKAKLHELEYLQDPIKNTDEINKLKRKLNTLESLRSKAREIRENKQKTPQLQQPTQVQLQQNWQYQPTQVQLQQDWHQQPTQVELEPGEQNNSEQLDNLIRLLLLDFLLLDTTNPNNYFASDDTHIYISLHLRSLILSNHMLLCGQISLDTYYKLLTINYDDLYEQFCGKYDNFTESITNSYIMEYHRESISSKIKYLKKIIKNKPKFIEFLKMQIKEIISYLKQKFKIK